MIRFDDGSLYVTDRITGDTEEVAGHRRDVLTITAHMTYPQAIVEFGNRGWGIEDGDIFYDKSSYNILASVCDNMDGTVTVRMGRKNTVEEDLYDEANVAKAEAAALSAENEELNAQIDELIVEVLEGGA